MCENTVDVDEATAGPEIGPTQYCLPNRITDIPMNPATLEWHAIRWVGKCCQLHLMVRGVGTAGEERMFKIHVETGVQVKLVRKGLLSA